MGINLLRITLFTVRVAPFVAVLAAQVVQLVGDAADDALCRLSRLGAGNGGYGNVGFVF